MKVKIFEVVLRKLPSGKSPATALEEQLDQFLAQRPEWELVSSHMSTLVSPAEPNAMLYRLERATDKQPNPNSIPETKEHHGRSDP